MSPQSQPSRGPLGDQNTTGNPSSPKCMRKLRNFLGQWHGATIILPTRGNDVSFWATSSFLEEQDSFRCYTDDAPASNQKGGKILSHQQWLPNNLPFPLLASRSHHTDRGFGTPSSCNWPARMWALMKPLFIRDNDFCGSMLFSKIRWQNTKRWILWSSNLATMQFVRPHLQLIS